MEDNDRGDIQRLVEGQFSSLTWSPDRPANWDAFAGDFLADALLFPSARPVKSLTAEAFVNRMKSLAGSTLRSFDERVLGTHVRIFGNVACAAVACEIIENGAGASRSVEMLLLVKTDGSWRIASQAWDKESLSTPLPAELVGTR